MLFGKVNNEKMIDKMLPYLKANDVLVLMEDFRSPLILNKLEKVIITNGDANIFISLPKEYMCMGKIFRG